MFGGAIIGPERLPTAASLATDWASMPSSVSVMLLVPVLASITILLVREKTSCMVSK